MINVAIVGHIDHGKSTLIGRLLYDTKSLPEGKIKEIENTCKQLGQKLEFAFIVDALEEERKNMMTIDTTQTFFRSRREYAIIDAPGHKEFLKNMATGVSQADLAILIVAADEGVKEQTKRHAYLLKLLGIPEIIVAINKMDKVGFSKEVYEKVKKDTLEYLEKIGIEPRFVIPISAYYGDNVVHTSKKMNWYNGPTLVETMDSLEVKKDFQDFRFVVQDVFEVNGEKVYVGNVLAGEIKKGEDVFVYPERKKVRVEKILIDSKEVESVKHPKAIGLVVDGKLKRGDVLAKNSEPIVMKKLTTPVFCLLDEIKKDEEYVIRCATQEAKCKVEKILEKIDVESLERIQGNELKETEIGAVKMSFDKPLVFEKISKIKELGRFVILKRGRIIAGGIVA